MSSGKSTLINALLQQELLPSGNSACTAQVTRIIDHDGMENFEAICYGGDNKTIIYPKSEITLGKMKKYNADEKVKYIDVYGDIPGIPSDRIRLCLRDTPGPNNSQNEEHKKLTEKIIRRRNSVVLYVMNVAQMGIEDDKNLLNSIAYEIKRGGKETRDRFIFVLNKCDVLDPEKGETVDKKIEEAKNYLKGFGIYNPMIIPTNAYLALLIQKSLNGDELTSRERKALKDIEDYVEDSLLHYEVYTTLTPSVKAELKKKLEKYKNDDEMQAMIHTGVSIVEETIREYIEKYAYPMKIRDAVEDVISIIKNLDMDVRLKKTLNENKEKRKIFKQQIKEAEKLIDSTQNIKEDFALRINKFDKTKEADKTKEVDKIIEDIRNIENKKIESIKAKCLMPLNGQDKIDKEKADEIIDKFIAELNEVQKDMYFELRSQIDQRIVKEGNNLLKQYREEVQSVLSNINITGYDFREVYSIKQFEVRNLDELKEENMSVRHREETRYMDNPEREGFFGFFKFWEPKEICYKVSVKDGININVKKVLIKIVTEFGIKTTENIDNMVKQEESQVDQYINIFTKNLDGLQKEIDKTIEKLGRLTEQKKNKDQQIEENRDLLQWIEEIQKRMNEILEF